MKDCLKYQEMISAMLDGELTSQQQRELEEHLALCPECRAMHTAFLSLSEAIGEDSIPAPAGLHDKIMTGVKAVEKKNKRSNVFTLLRPYMTAAACLVVIVAAVLAARESGLLGGMTKSDAAMDAKTESVTMETESYDYSTDTAKMEQQSAPAEGVAADNAAKAESAVEEEAEATKEETTVEDVTTESGAAETTPEPSPTPEPVVLDAVECVLTTTADGETVTEVLSETDIKVWLSTLILKGYDFDEFTDPTRITHTMVITRESGEVYTVYLHYADDEQLMLSREEDGSEAIEVKTVRDFTVYAEETEADK